MDFHKGYPRDRFPELKGDSFDCGICYLVCQEPKECEKCGAMYCSYCIDDWISKKNECPIGCSDAKSNIKPISGALAKIYRNLDIKCKHPNCGSIVKLCDLSYHETVCQLPKCQQFEHCGSYLKPETRKSGTCSAACELMNTIKGANGDLLMIYEGIKSLTQRPRFPVHQTNLQNSQFLTNFKWDINKKGKNIEVSNDQKTIFIKEDSYNFRTILGDEALLGGIHYWEIHADSRTENELKIGVSLSSDFDTNTSFSDYVFGFAYYGLGQLRHNENSSGKLYGKRFRKEGVLGVFLNMNKGTLSFALDGEDMGIAFKDEALKRGPIYPAVSLLHLAGCTLETGKGIPSYYLESSSE